MAERLLYLVRHAEVITSGDRPAPDWPLSARGRSDARRLAAAPEWRSLALVVSSPEGKARATAAPIADAAGVELGIEDDLREVERAKTPIVTREEYKALVAAHFASPEVSVNGWELGSDARARVVACVERLADGSDAPICVVSHALLLSHYLAHLRGLSHPLVEEWQAIPLPAVAVIDLAAGRLLEDFVSVGAFLARG